MTQCDRFIVCASDAPQNARGVSARVPGALLALWDKEEQGSQADLYPFTIYDPIPGFPLPLQAGEAEPPIDLNTLLDDVHAEGSYGIRIDYRQPPRPPLSEDEARWAKQIIAE